MLERTEKETPVTPDMDTVTFEVVHNAFLNVTEEMAVTIRRSAYSTNIKTRADFSCAYFDDKFRCIAQSFSQPSHLVAMATIAPNVLREVGAENFRPGDAFLVNDPYRGSAHLNDILMITPVDHEGVRLGYVASMAHHIDVGGSSAASLGVSSELFQEGIIIPPTRVASIDTIDLNVFNLLLSNIRAPRETGGDLRAQISAGIVGRRRIASLAAQYSPETIFHFCDELIAYTERWTDREIRQLPEGTFGAEGYRDDDGFSEDPVRLKVAITVADGHVRMDVTGSSPQVRGPLNCNRATAKCAVAYVTRCLVDNRVPVNEGFLSRIHVDGPDGLVCTAQRPSAVAGGFELCMLLTDVVFKAFHEPLPDRIPAAGKGLIVNIGFGGIDPRRGEYYCYMETVGGGNGARPYADGPDGVQTNIQNTENAPIEEVEINYPLRIRRYELIPDSAGPGRYRGGCGIRRDFEFPFSDCTWTVLSDGRKFPPWGLAGGGAGRPAHYVYDPDGEARELRSKSTIDVVKGKTVRVETPGGGGFGDPSGRDRTAVERDVRDGKLTAEGARAYDADRLS
jgi:N-methylhydantoinase B